LKKKLIIVVKIYLSDWQHEYRQENMGLSFSCFSDLIKVKLKRRNQEGRR